MDYTQALEWVHGLPRIAGTSKLNKMRALLATMGNPQRQLRFVHVAGTNGKGSTVMMLASILKEAGYKTGANISPYILNFRERFLIDGEMVGEARLAEILTEVRRAVESMTEPYIEFEAVTAAALLYFAQEQCDIVCIEVGIGGRLDATNVIENTLVACITKIGLDHTEMLGDTLTKISTEKCGIFKKGSHAVVYPAQASGVMEEIIHCAKAKGCPVTVPALEDFRFFKSGHFCNKAEYGGYELLVPFVGEHQVMNASVAVEAALSLWRQGFDINDEHIIRGIENARIPARIEIISHTPLIIVDGAHNEDSAKALADTLHSQKVGNLSAVVGVLRDKQAEQMIRHVAPYVSEAYTVAPDNPRAMSAHELAKLVGRFVPMAVACDTVVGALRLAQESGHGGVLVFGSLYLAAEARALLCGKG